MARDIEIEYLLFGVGAVSVEAVNGFERENLSTNRRERPQMTPGTMGDRS